MHKLYETAHFSGCGYGLNYMQNVYGVKLARKKLSFSCM